jgi:predicted O-methyltransferase YrrM
MLPAMAMRSLVRWWRACFINWPGSAKQKPIFEMGSAIGYSTIWWARAVGEGGRVIYTDGDPKRADKARRYFDRAGVADRITVRVGDALEVSLRGKREVRHHL